MRSRPVVGILLLVLAIGTAGCLKPTGGRGEPVLDTEEGPAPGTLTPPSENGSATTAPDPEPSTPTPSNGTETTEDTPPSPDVNESDPVPPKDPEPEAPREPTPCRPADAPSTLLCKFSHEGNADAGDRVYTFDVPANVHWICFEWTADTTSGAAKLTVMPASGENVTLADRATDGTGAQMIEVANRVGTWRIVLTADAWTGMLTMDVTLP